MRFENKVFANELITLDDNEFVDCTFTGCTFRYNGGQFNISRIAFDSMRFEMEGAAARTVLLLQSLRSNEIGRRIVEGLLDPARANSPPQ
jgi:hypothetical protein